MRSKDSLRVFIYLDLLACSSATCCLLLSVCQGFGWITAPPLVDRHDVWDPASLGFLLAILLACLPLVTPSWFLRHRRIRYLVALLAFHIILDRILLLGFGYSLWEVDPYRGFRHRPSVVRHWGEGNLTTGDRPLFQGRWIYTNQWGFHDDEFPLKKPEGEFRILLLGDSVTMGHGVERDATFAYWLEHYLETAWSEEKVQAINTGVQGYSIIEEWATLLASLAFDPDLVVVQFCSNDVTEPATIYPFLGGRGFFYDLAIQKSRIYSWALNNLGMGRLALYCMRNWYRWRGRTGIEQLYRVDAAIPQEGQLPAFSLAKLNRWWGQYERGLEGIYDTCYRQNIPCVFLICPYGFQILKPQHFDATQEFLHQHARRFGVPLLDLTPRWREEITLRVLDTDFLGLDLLADTTPVSQILLDYWRGVILNEYLLDQVHLTELGHRRVGQWLAAKIIELDKEGRF